MSSSVDEALGVLTAFSCEMRDWEIACARSLASHQAPSDAATSRQLLTDRLRAIFAKYTTNSGTPARLRNGGLHVITPSSYRDKASKVVAVKESADGTLLTVHVSLRTKLPGLSDEFLYTFIRTDSGWRLQDDRQRLRSDGSITPWDL